MDCSQGHLAMRLQASFNVHPGVRLTILSIMTRISYFPQSLRRGFGDPTIFFQLPEFELQLVNLVSVNPNHFLNFVLILLIEVIQSIIILLQPTKRDKAENPASAL